MRKIFVLCFLFILLLSCSNEQESLLEGDNNNISYVVKPQKRMIFADLHEMDSITSCLDKMPYTEQQSWSRRHIVQTSHDKSPIEIKDVSYHNRLNSFKSILNSDLEFQIKDSIMWYHNDVVYYLGKDANINLEDLKLNTNLLDVYFKYHIASLDEIPMSREAKKLLILRGGMSESKDQGGTSCLNFNGGNFKLNARQLRTFEALTYPEEGDYPDKEVYYDHQLDFTLYCERRETSHLSSKNYQTYKIYIKYYLSKRTEMNGEIYSYMLFLNGKYGSGEISLLSDVDYYVTAQLRPMGLSGSGPIHQYHSSYSQDIVYDFGDNGGEIFLFQTGDGYPQLTWYYMTYNFTIKVPVFKGSFMLNGLGAAAPKIQINI